MITFEFERYLQLQNGLSFVLLDSDPCTFVDKLIQNETNF